MRSAIRWDSFLASAECTAQTGDPVMAALPQPAAQGVKTNIASVYQRPLANTSHSGYIHLMTDVHNELLEDEDFDTILAEDIDFSGNLSFEKPFLIRGKLSGQIAAHGLLVIDSSAVVEADIQAPTVVVRGSVKGNINATEKVEITATGKLEGNISTPVIFMESGCFFNGRCTMTNPKAAPHFGPDRESADES
jgi:cytoskeletal protein CcmA (bactofilin family)